MARRVLTPNRALLARYSSDGFFSERDCALMNDVRIIPDGLLLNRLYFSGSPAPLRFGISASAASTDSSTPDNLAANDLALGAGGVMKHSRRLSEDGCLLCHQRRR